MEEVPSVKFLFFVSSPSVEFSFVIRIYVSLHSVWWAWDFPKIQLAVR